MSNDVEVKGLTAGTEDRKLGRWVGSNYLLGVSCYRNGIIDEEHDERFIDAAKRNMAGMVLILPPSFLGLIPCSGE